VVLKGSVPTGNFAEPRLTSGAFDVCRRELTPLKPKADSTRAGGQVVVWRLHSPWADEDGMIAKTRAMVDGKWKAVADELGVD